MNNTHFVITNATDFTDDVEKMHDFYNMCKEEFLKSYYYLTEEEYDLTVEAVNLMV